MSSNKKLPPPSKPTATPPDLARAWSLNMEKPRKPFLTYSQVDLERVDRLEKQQADQEQAQMERAALKDKDLH